MRWLCAVLLVAASVAAVAAGQREGSSTPASSRDRFVGTWKLVGVETKDARGQVVPPAPGTPERIGYIIYDPAGYIAVSIMPVGRKKYAGLQATDAEAQAAMRGYTGYYGTFIVDDAAGAVTHRLQGSLNPGMATDQVRRFTFAGNRLTLRPPASANGNQASLTWERMPDLPNPTDEQRKFFGFWKLVSNERRNQRGDLVASNPGQTGYIIYTPAGLMMVHMMQPKRQPFAAAQPTPAEAKAAMTTYTNYFGPFIVHAADGYVVHDQYGTLNIGRNGPGPLQRFFTFTDNRLLLRPPLTDGPDGQTVQATITWERAPHQK